MYTFKYLSENSLGKTMDYINFDDVTIVDDYTVHVGMNYPYSALLDCLVKVSLIPMDACEKMGDAFAPRSDRLRSVQVCFLDCGRPHRAESQ